MKFFASRKSFYNTRGDFITDTTTSQYIWGALFSEGVSAETIATPLYPPLTDESRHVCIINTF